jgi:hypothetical protein
MSQEYALFDPVKDRVSVPGPVNPLVEIAASIYVYASFGPCGIPTT